MKAEAEINKMRYARAKTNKNFSSTQSRERFAFDERESFLMRWMSCDFLGVLLNHPKRSQLREFSRQALLAPFSDCVQSHAPARIIHQ